MKDSRPPGESPGESLLNLVGWLEDATGRLGIGCLGLMAIAFLLGVFIDVTGGNTSGSISVLKYAGLALLVSAGASLAFHLLKSQIIDTQSWLYERKRKRQRDQQ